MQVSFWGVRGSYPVPGSSTLRYGGHTSCVEVRNDAGEVLIVDAGTGLRALGKQLAREHAGSDRATYNIILSHVHWDHIQGLPFFEPVYLPGRKLVVHAPRAAAEEIKKVIGGITRQEFFPVDLEATAADIDYQQVVAGEDFDLGHFAVTPIGLNHPFGAVGYRIDGDGSSVAYVADTAPFDRMLHKQHFTPEPETPSKEDLEVLANMRANLVERLRGVDSVIYDTHFTPEEYERFPHWGHSSPEHALAICDEASVRQLVLYHHAPSHTDDMMDEIARTYASKGSSIGLTVTTAKEGMTLGIGENTNPGVAP